MTYKLDISESQRKALIELLKTVDTNTADETEITGFHPLWGWVEALEGIPEVEAAHPGVDMLHGLCV